ncbi:hypothetical protein FWG76_00215 [Candidatus Saccharibacteria bacterium]|nr:hypothetical protein [Candidatus Saccharibacteria bacterium]
MTNNMSISNGGLAQNTLFFGSGTSELVSTPTADVFDRLGWNDDRTRSIVATQPWWLRGSEAEYESGSGIFAFHGQTALAYFFASHRTILLGY